MMFRKSLACVMICAAVCFNSAVCHAYAYIDFMMAPQPTPVVDGPTSVPLTIVSIAQTLVNSYSSTERQLQRNLSKRVAGSIDLGFMTINIGASRDTRRVAKGFFQRQNNVTRQYTGMSTRQLARITQDGLTTTAGTLESISAYNKARAEDRVNRVIDLVASAIVIKSGMATLKETMDTVMKNNEGDAADYNEALTNNATIRLVYDQLLSLEQQLVAQRLQIRGAMAEYGIQPVHESLQGE